MAATSPHRKLRILAMEYAVRLADIGEKPQATLARAHAIAAFISSSKPIAEERS